MFVFAYRSRRNGVCYYIKNGPCWETFGPGFWSRGFGTGSQHTEFGDLSYENVDTALSKEEYERASRDGANLDIVASLTSDEALAFAGRIREEELAMIEETHGLGDSDARFVVSSYEKKHGFWDRNIVAAVYFDWEDAAQSKAYDCQGVQFDDRYFDYAAFAEDLKEDSDFMELPDSGKVVQFAS